MEAKFFTKMVCDRRYYVVSYWRG